MNEDRNVDPRADGEDPTLSADLGAAIRRRSESLDGIPPVADVVGRAAAGASARRLRYTLVGVAATAALLAGGLVAWNTLGGDGDGSVRVASAPVTSAAAPASPGPAGPPAADPLAPGLQPADPLPAGTELGRGAAAGNGLDGAEPPGRTAADPAEPPDDPETVSPGCETPALTDARCWLPEALLEHFLRGHITITKDGYQLRLDEPPGGMTLWDLAGDAPVYELGPEALNGGAVPDGVRVTRNDDGSVTVVLEHPETGEDLIVMVRTSSTGLTLEGPWPDLRIEELLPDFDWPEPPDFDWPEVPEFDWPEVPEFDWPEPDDTFELCLGGEGGYELRLDQPAGGMTLWDRTAGAPLYELSAEALESGVVPDGVRLTRDDDGSITVVFEHPETGDHLATFKRTLRGDTEIEELTTEFLWLAPGEVFGPCLDAGSLFPPRDWLDEIEASIREMLAELSGSEFNSFTWDFSWRDGDLELPPDLAELLERWREALPDPGHPRPTGSGNRDVRRA